MSRLVEPFCVLTKFEGFEKAVYKPYLPNANIEDFKNKKKMKTSK